MSAAASAPPVPAAPPGPRRRSPRAKLGIGLLLTLVGLFVLGGTLPTQSGTLERAVAVTGLGVVALWLGGLFLGLGGRR